MAVASVPVPPEVEGLVGPLSFLRLRAVPGPAVRPGLLESAVSIPLRPGRCSCPLGRAFCRHGFQRAKVKLRSLVRPALPHRMTCLPASLRSWCVVAVAAVLVASFAGDALFVVRHKGRC